ncbi:hypothetical protein BDY19DRAFT_972147 [Irpex rosettiformis]|uniref:Uncharacterized protein n=1 Tax=Irpex rosettiformis TaxID=378272 RepID=A0ACB8TQG8_9APHY|nr:hypothetical protein BDY19DRAFT_972147 [Irpex rosettiformis]
MTSAIGCGGLSFGCISSECDTDGGCGSRGAGIRRGKELVSFVVLIPGQGSQWALYVKGGSRGLPYMIHKYWGIYSL